MNSQILRIIIAGVIAIGGLTSITVLAITGSNIPALIETMATGALFYLFGVVTNGSGLGMTKPPDKPQ